MFSNIFLFVYIFAGFAGGLAILMAVLLIKYWSSGNKKLLAAIRNFMICTALIDALYFYFDYDMLINGEYGTNAVCRVLDICLFIGQVYFWTSYVRIKSMKDAESLKSLERSTRAGALLCVVMAVAGYGFMMSDYYQAAEGPGRTAAVIIEAVLMTLLTVLNLWNVIYALSEIIQKKCRRYIICITATLVVNGVWNGILVISILNGKLSYVMQSVMDPTPLFLLIMNVLTILLILSEDFTALFRADSSGKSSSDAGVITVSAGGRKGRDADEDRCDDATCDGCDSSGAEAGSGARDCSDARCADARDGSIARGSGAHVGSDAGGTAVSTDIACGREGHAHCAADSTGNVIRGGFRDTADDLQKRLDYIAETHFLTEREREVMELAYSRMTNPEIAEKLCISKYTVKNHMHNIFEKLDISSRADLILFVDKNEQSGKVRE